MTRFSFYLISTNVVLSLTAGSAALFIELFNKHSLLQTLHPVAEPSFLLLCLNATLILFFIFVIYVNEAHNYY